MLIYIILSAISEDDKVTFSSRKKDLNNISYKLSPLETFFMKSQSLFSGGKWERQFKMSFAKFLSSMQSV